jgi:hypothetical protein
VVNLSESRDLQLTPFETLVAQSKAVGPVQSVRERLAELEVIIAQAEGVVDEKHVQLEAAQEAFRARRAEVQQVVLPPQNWTYLTALIAVVAWFLVLFVLEGTAWMVAFGVGIACLVLSWASHSRWLGAESWAQGELSQASITIAASEAELSDAYVQLQDRVLERELRQRELVARASSNQ